MESLGFKRKPSGFTRWYIFDDKKVTLDYIEFTYEDEADESSKCFFDEEIVSYGDLESRFTAAKPRLLSDEEKALQFDEELRLKKIKEEGIDTELKYWKELEPHRFKWYETALKLKEKFNAIVSCDDIEIDPDKPFPEVSESKD